MLSNSDSDLVKRASRSWSTFAATGKTYQPGHDLVEGWTEAYKNKEGPYAMTIGGPHEGLSALHGPQAIAEVERQKLDERCAFLNNPEIIKALGY